MLESTLVDDDKQNSEDEKKPPVTSKKAHRQKVVNNYNDSVVGYLTSVSPKMICRGKLIRSPNVTEDILISDSVADCTLLSIKSWHVFEETGYCLALGSRFAKESPELDIVHAATVVTLQDGTSYLLVVYHGLLDRDQTQSESMLLPYHARDSGVVIDDLPPHHTHKDGTAGTQAAYVGNITLPFYYDDKMMYWTIRKPTPEELDDLPIVELTSSEMPEHYSKGSLLCYS